MADSKPPRSPGFLLRRVVLEDIPALHSMIEISIRELHTPFYTSEQIEQAVKSIYIKPSSVEDGNCFAVLNRAQGQGVPTDVFISSDELVIGCSGWSQRPAEPDFPPLDPEKDAAKLTAMYVHPKCVRRGVAKALLEACELSAREKSFKRIEFIATLAGIQFYKRMRYEIIDKGNGKEGSKFKDARDGLLVEFKEMSKNLD